MEKDKGGRVLALAALLVGVIGLSLGFAAFSSTLNVQTNANVQVGTKWDVGFSADGTTMAPKVLNGAPTVTGTVANTTLTGTPAAGSISLMKYTISQATVATISTEANSSVSYDFFILNDGEIDATLQSIAFGSFTCTYLSGADANRVIDQDASNVGARVTAQTGEIAAADCATMFAATLTIGGTTYDKDSKNFSNTIAKHDKVAATLTLKSTGTTPTNVPTGDFNVALGNTTIVYTSA